MARNQGTGSDAGPFLIAAMCGAICASTGIAKASPGVTFTTPDRHDFPRHQLMPKPAPPQFLAVLGRTIQEGVRLERQGKLAEAERVYVRILKTLPDQIETLLLADLKLRRGKAGEAFRRASAAITARPRSVEAHIRLGHVPSSPLNKKC
jgi:hypothetical protein